MKTTPFDKTKPDSELKRYPFPPKRLFIEEYGINDLRSALFTRAGQKLVEFDEQIKNLESRFIIFTQLSFVIFSLVVAVIAVLSRVNSENITLSAAFFAAATIALSMAAVLIAAFSYVRGRVGRLVYEQYGRVMGDRAQAAQRFLRRSWLIGMTICIVFAFVTCWAIYRTIEPVFRDLRQQRVVTKTDLDSLAESISANINGLSKRVGELERRR